MTVVSVFAGFAFFAILGIGMFRYSFVSILIIRAETWRSSETGKNAMEKSGVCLIKPRQRPSSWTAERYYPGRQLVSLFSENAKHV